MIVLVGDQLQHGVACNPRRCGETLGASAQLTSNKRNGLQPGLTSNRLNVLMLVFHACPREATPGLCISDRLITDIVDVEIVFPRRPIN